MYENQNQDPKVLGERLQLARKAAAKTQEEAAQYLTMSRPTFIAIEKGQRPVSPEELIKLATLYGRSLHELQRPGPPVSLVPHLRAVVDPERDDTAEIEMAIKELERFAEDYKELEELLRAPLVTNYPPEVRLPSRGNIYELAEDTAVRERARLQLGDQPILNVRRILESEVGVRIFYGSMPTKLAGMYAFVDGLAAAS